MNFFKLYIGDYQRDTAHLSVTEHGAFMLMLQHYYATEKPLPAGKALHRMLRAQEKAERDAIDTVAAQFWRATSEGLVNDRADAEISKAATQGETNARIAREREAKRKVQREQHDGSTNRATNDQPNQTPDTRHQTPDLEFKDTDCSTEAGRVCGLLRKVGGISDASPGNTEFRALCGVGVSDDEWLEAARITAEKGKRFDYLLGVVKGRRAEASETARTVHRGPKPASETATQRAHRERAEQFAPDVAAKAKPATPTAEVIDVTARRLG